VRDGALGFGGLQAMTRSTELGLSRLDELSLEGLRAVNAMAGRAGQVASLVGTAFPARVIAAVVTGQARLVRFSVPDLSELPNIPFVVVVDVRLSRTVAALAAMGCLRRAWILRLRVSGALERITL
jgi:hypothetical protein